MPTVEEPRFITQSSVHLDAVRGAAALAVLLGHTHVLFLAAGKQKHAAAVTGADSPVQTGVAGVAAPGVPNVEPAAGITTGNEAVMVFFVLSGYLVGGSVIKAVRRNTWSWRDYMIKRMTRLWVVLIPAILFGAALDWAGLHWLGRPGSIYTAPVTQTLVRAGVAARLAPSVLLGNIGFVQDILVSKVGTNEALWSLANEFWYYIAFPLLLLAFAGRRKMWVRWACVLLVLGIGWFVGPAIAVRFPVWVLGAALFAVPLRLPDKAARIASIAGMVLLPVVFLGVRKLNLPNLGAQAIIAVYTAALLYVLLHARERARNGVYRHVAGFFSRISYTLYLVHLPLAVFVSAVLFRPWRPWPKSPTYLVLFALVNAALVGGAYLFYRAFEANTDRIRKRFFAV